MRIPVQREEANGRQIRRSEPEPDGERSKVAKRVSSLSRKAAIVFHEPVP